VGARAGGIGIGIDGSAVVGARAVGIGIGIDGSASAVVSAARGKTDSAGGCPSSPPPLTMRSLRERRCAGGGGGAAGLLVAMLGGGLMIKSIPAARRTAAWPAGSARSTRTHTHSLPCAHRGSRCPIAAANTCLSTASRRCSACRCAISQSAALSGQTQSAVAVGSTTVRTLSCTGGRSRCTCARAAGTSIAWLALAAPPQPA
jgi:hypothetical protein